MKLEKPSEEAQAIAISHPCSGRTWSKAICDLLRNGSVEFTHDIVKPPREDSLSWSELRALRLSGELSAARKEAYGDRPIIFIKRNLLDTIVSYYYQKRHREHFLYEVGKNIHPPAFHGTMDELIHHEIYGAKRLLEFHKSCPENAFVLTYEAMFKDTLGTMTKMLRFCGMKGLFLSDIRHAIDEASFAKKRENERKGFQSKMLQSVVDWERIDDSRIYKCRKGGIGKYKEELTDNQVRAIRALL